MKRHICGDDCRVCEEAAEERSERDDFDLDGSMANRAADRYEREVLGL